MKMTLNFIKSAAFQKALKYGYLVLLIYVVFNDSMWENLTGKDIQHAMKMGVGLVLGRSLIDVFKMVTGTVTS